LSLGVVLMKFIRATPGKESKQNFHRKFLLIGVIRFKLASLPVAQLDALAYNLFRQLPFPSLLSICNQPESKLRMPKMTKVPNMSRSYELTSMNGGRRGSTIEFADPVQRIYPIETEAGIRAALNFINHKDTASKYTPDQIEEIRNRILKAARKHGLKISVAEK
jgi:hypothetical protein